MGTQENQHVVPVWVWSPENQDSWWHKVQLDGQQARDPRKPMFHFESKGRKRPVSQFKAGRRSKRSSLSLSLFVPFRSSTDWMRPTVTGEGHLLYSVSWLNQRFISHRNTRTDTSRTVLDQMSWRPVAQARWQQKLSIAVLQLFCTVWDGMSLPPRRPCGPHPEIVLGAPAVCSHSSRPLPVLALRSTTSICLVSCLGCALASLKALLKWHLIREAFPEHHFLKNFYWSRVDLLCCVSFRCTAKWISYTYTYIHSL